MNLEKNTILEIKNLIQDYQNKQADINFFNKIINILNQDILFNNILKLIVDNGKYEMACELQQKYLGNIFMNYEKTCKSIKNDVLCFLDKENKKYNELFNFFGLFFLLHECSHVIQCYWGYFGKNNYQVINDIYKLLIDQMNNSLYARIIYELKRMNFFHERNANLLALNCLENIYSEDEHIMMINYEYYIYNFFAAYNLKKETTPVEYAYKLLNKKCNINTENITYQDILLYGLPMNNNEWSLFSQMYEMYKNNSDIFTIKKEIDKKIK